MQLIKALEHKRLYFSHWQGDEIYVSTSKTSVKRGFAPLLVTVPKWLKDAILQAEKEAKECEKSRINGLLGNI